MGRLLHREREAASQRDLIGWMDGDDDDDRFDYGRWTFLLA